MRSHCYPYMNFTPVLFHAAQQRILLALQNFTDLFFSTHHLSVFLSLIELNIVRSVCWTRFKRTSLLLLGDRYIRPHIWTVWQYIKLRATGRGSLQFAPVFENLQLNTKRRKRWVCMGQHGRERKRERETLTQDLQCICNMPLSKPIWLFLFNALLLNPYHWTYHGHKRGYLHLVIRTTSSHILLDIDHWMESSILMMAMWPGCGMQ